MLSGIGHFAAEAGEGIFNSVTGTLGALENFANDPTLAKRLTGVLESALGKDKVAATEPQLASEDFSYYVEQGIPSFYFQLGGADPQKLARAIETGVPLPSNHSPLFAPEVDPALHTAITAEVAVLRNLLNGSAAELRKSISPQSGAK